MRRGVKKVPDDQSGEHKKERGWYKDWKCWYWWLKAVFGFDNYYFTDDFDIGCKYFRKEHFQKKIAYMYLYIYICSHIMGVLCYVMFTVTHLVTLM